jgi:hypothetical protein
VCPPAVGFLKAAPSVFPNVARVEDGSYVILTGGTGDDARKCRTVALPEVLDWVHSIFTAGEPLADIDIGVQMPSKLDDTLRR